MKAVRFDPHANPSIAAADLTEDVTEWDERVYREITSTELTPAQIERVEKPSQIFPRQESVLALHWHPEFVPMELIRRRVNAMFPGRRSELIIPTQHNVLMEWDGFAGVEIDCYSPGFDLKVQLLAHFSASRLDRADVLRAMLAHTRKYRASQLYDFMNSIIEPQFEDRVRRGAAKTGASAELVHFVRVHVRKLRAMIEDHEHETPAEMLKNKLLRYYFDALRERHSAAMVNHAQVFLNAVKYIVKADFALSYFYQTEEIIEEVRGLGGGIVIPHPEQFWPILLADYDVDGIEVWNPQSQQYTEFLINCVHRQNKTTRRGRKPLLIFMGDDTHFGEKTLDPCHQDEEKASRELGYQPAWDDLMIRKSLIVADVDRPGLIEEYKRRLS